MKPAIIIPVYNHHAQIGEVIRQSLIFGLPIIVVNDGSTDFTSQILKGLPGIMVLHHLKNKGKGAAILTGMGEAQKMGCDFAITLDGDGQHKPEDLPRLLAVITNKDPCIVIGRRQGMKKGRNVPWTSRFGKEFSNFWVWASGGPLVEDSQSGFRIYPIAEILDLDIRAMRYQFEVETLVKAKQRGIKIKEAPVQVVYQAKGERVSHFRPWVDFWRNSMVFNRLIWARMFRVFKL